MSVSVLRQFICSDWLTNTPGKCCTLADFRQTAKDYAAVCCTEIPSRKEADIDKLLRELYENAGVLPQKMRATGKNTRTIVGVTIRPSRPSSPNPIPILTQSSEQQPLEKAIQMALCEQLHGSRTEVTVPCGRVDLVNDGLELVMEIKIGRCWMHGLGQLISYGIYFPKFRKILQLFGPLTVDKELIVSTAASAGVSVWFWPYKLPDILTVGQ